MKIVKRIIVSSALIATGKANSETIASNIKKNTDNLQKISTIKLLKNKTGIKIKFSSDSTLTRKCGTDIE